jgi:hypothetical protein
LKQDTSARTAPGICGGAPALSGRNQPDQGAELA